MTQRRCFFFDFGFRNYDFLMNVIHLHHGNLKEARTFYAKVFSLLSVVMFIYVVCRVCYLLGQVLFVGANLQ